MEKYDPIRVLGEGSFGKVYLMRDKVRKKFLCVKVIKIKNIPKKEREATKLEVDLLRRLKHPNIVQYIDSFLSRNNESLCIAMEYCDGGDLASQIKAARRNLFSENKILHWFVQIALGLHYMHTNKVLHRDLKSQNIFLLGNGRLVLGDLGISKVLDGTMDFAQTCIGTPYYMSPEIFKNKPYSYKSDVWALGCLLYEMTTLTHAFDANSLNGLAQKIVKGRYPPIHAKYSKYLRELISQMLHISPQQRPDLDQILRKPFVRKHVVNFFSDISSRPSGSVGEGTIIMRAAVGGGPPGAMGAESRDPNMINLRSQLHSLEMDEALQKAMGPQGAPTNPDDAKKVVKEQASALRREVEHKQMVQAALEKLRKEREQRVQEREKAAQDAMAGRAGLRDRARERARGISDPPAPSAISRESRREREVAMREAREKKEAERRESDRQARQKLIDDRRKEAERERERVRQQERDEAEARDKQRRDQLAAADAQAAAAAKRESQRDRERARQRQEIEQLKKDKMELDRRTREREKQREAQWSEERRKIEEANVDRNGGISDRGSGIPRERSGDSSGIPRERSGDSSGISRERSGDRYQRSDDKDDHSGGYSRDRGDRGDPRGGDARERVPRPRAEGKESDRDRTDSDSVSSRDSRYGGGEGLSARDRVLMQKQQALAREEQQRVEALRVAEAENRRIRAAAYNQGKQQYHHAGQGEPPPAAAAAAAAPDSGYEFEAGGRKPRLSLDSAPQKANPHAMNMDELNRQLEDAVGGASRYGGGAAVAVGRQGSGGSVSAVAVSDSSDEDPVVGDDDEEERPVVDDSDYAVEEEIRQSREAELEAELNLATRRCEDLRTTLRETKSFIDGKARVGTSHAARAGQPGAAVAAALPDSDLDEEDEEDVFDYDEDEDGESGGAGKGTAAAPAHSDASSAQPSAPPSSPPSLFRYDFSEAKAEGKDDTTEVTPRKHRVQPIAVKQSPYYNLQDPPSPSGRLADRIVRLRQRCIEALGAGAFQDAYAFLKQSDEAGFGGYREDAEEQRAGRVRAILGEGKAHYMPLIEQLLFMEETHSG